MFRRIGFVSALVLAFSIVAERKPTISIYWNILG